MHRICKRFQKGVATLEDVVRVYQAVLKVGTLASPTIDSHRDSARRPYHDAGERRGFGRVQGSRRRGLSVEVEGLFGHSFRQPTLALIIEQGF